MPWAYLGGVTHTTTCRRVTAGALALTLAGLPAAAAQPPPAADPPPVLVAAEPLDVHEVETVLAVRTVRALRATRMAPARPPVRVARPRPARPPHTHTPTHINVGRYGSGSVREVLTFARAQLGKPYVWAAAGPGGYDCSGLVVAAYRRIGILLPHQTGGLIRHGRPVRRDELRPGDLVFPSSGHVGIYVGAGLMIHAPQPGETVKIGRVYAFWAARRLL